MRKKSNLPEGKYFLLDAVSKAADPKVEIFITETCIYTKFIKLNKMNFKNIQSVFTSGVEVPPTPPFRPSWRSDFSRAARESAFFR